ncbi:MAG: hypothetical protein AABX11_01615 [Nanoarchaeota archaeon]
MNEKSDFGEKMGKSVMESEKRKEFKDTYLKDVMVLAPFKRNKVQRNWASIGLIVSFLLIISNPFSFFISSISIPINGFIIGFILGLTSLLYFFDSF